MKTKMICGMIPWMFWTLLAVVLFALFGPELIAIARAAEPVHSSSSLTVTSPVLSVTPATMERYYAVRLGVGEWLAVEDRAPHATDSIAVKSVAIIGPSFPTPETVVVSVALEPVVTKVGARWEITFKRPEGK